MTIKKRIVIWYTVWMAFIAVMMMAVIISASGVILQREIIADLEDNVHDLAGDMFVRNGSVLFDDDDIDFFDDGVYLSVWSNGELKAGRFPEEAPFDDFRDGYIRNLQGENGSWYCFDILAGENAYIRGVSRSYDMRTLFSSMQLLLFLLLPCVVILAALGGYIIVRRSFRPADKVIATAGDIAGSEDLSKRIGLGEGTDEIHQMAFAFDKMMDRIEYAFEKEKQFTSDASHELRTPISVILAEADYASGHTEDGEKMKDALDVISRQAGKMSRLVSELLLLARSDKGTLQLHPEPFDLGELGEIVLSTMEDKAREREITLSLKAMNGLVVEADQGIITRVIINLVSNAISYGREGGWVILRITSVDNNAVIEVEDNGIGISQEHLDRIWDRFYQVDAARSPDSSGAGLGLAIVRESVEAHGGNVSVESMEGQGSIFRVSIPIRQNDRASS